MKLNKVLFLISILSILSSACKKEGDLKINEAPNTIFSVEEINLSGDRRLNSIVRLSWFGTDPDGYVVGYELSYDRQNWFYTSSQDSTFRFSISAGSDTVDINLFVRAIDNDEQVDPSPAELVIPLKNTPPSVTFDEDLTIPDTTILVATTEWNATDIDGDETITQVLIRLNGNDWQEISDRSRIFSIVPTDPEATDTTDARIYYGSSDNPSNQLIQGLIMNDTNKIYIKVIDQAGTESEVDSSNTFFMKGKRNELLAVGGVPSSSSGNPAEIYKTSLQQAGLSFDFIDLLRYNGLYRPKIWNITFKLQLSFYDKLFFFSNESTYTNSYTNVSSLLLEFAAPSLQRFANTGGKYFITTAFSYPTNIEGFIGVLPIRSKSSINTSNAFLRQDSAIVSTLSGFPSLESNQFLLTNIGVFNIDSSDTEVLYTAQLSNGFSDPWNATKIIASGRRNGGKLNQVFFNIQLWRLNKDPNKLTALFDQIFNVEFN